MGVKLRQTDNSGGEGSCPRVNKLSMPSKFCLNIFLNDTSSFLQENLGISLRAFLNLGLTLLIGKFE